MSAWVALIRWQAALLMGGYYRIVQTGEVEAEQVRNVAVVISNPDAAVLMVHENSFRIVNVPG